jgi:succinate-acetate transporter protein
MTQTRVEPPTQPHRVPYNNGTERRVWTKAGPVDALVLADDDVEWQVEARETSTAEPASMALFGFAVGTFIVALPIAGVVPTSALIATLPPVLVFAGIAQFIGGLIAYRRGNAFGGTAFGVYGANNAVVGTYFILQSLGIVSTVRGTPSLRMLGVELMCFAFISLVLMIAALRLNASFTLVLLALVGGFALAGINDIWAAVTPVVGQIGGYCLIASAAFAAYAASAMVINSTWKRNLLPLGSFGH